MLKPNDIFSQVAHALWAHKLRSFLTMFGIAWGVASLLLLIGVGEGFRSGNRKQLSQIGDNVMFAFPGRVPAIPGSTTGMRPYLITYRDFLDVRNECRMVKRVGPVLSRDDIHAVSRFQNSIGTVVGVTSIFAQIRYVPIGNGRWFNEEEDEQERQVMVIGFEMRRRLLPDMRLPAIGEFIWLNGVQFEVVGVMDAIGKEENNPSNVRIYIPYHTMHRFFPSQGKNLPSGVVTNLIYQPLTRKYHIEARNEVRRILARNHRFDYALVEAFEDWDTVKSADTIDRVVDIMNMFLGSVGIATLGLGTIGVINIMLVSVTERTRAIGLMKALGATHRDIMAQFFWEGAILTFISGGLGILFSVGAMMALSKMTLPAGFDAPKLVPWAAGLSIGSLAIAGIVAGIYPARKAAILQPIEAMRRE